MKRFGDILPFIVAFRARFEHHVGGNSPPGSGAMESAPEFTSPAAGESLSYSVDRHAASSRRAEAVVLQVDSTVSAIDGLAWLTSRRDSETGLRLAALRREAAEQRWGWAELTRARLKLLRPRRAEINELGAAHLAALAPGAIDAVADLRRAGVAVALASDVAAEALFGVATALGVSPNELYAPRLRFDAIGAFVSCDLNSARPEDEIDVTGVRPGAAKLRTLFVGTRRTAVFAPRVTDDFVAFSGVETRGGASDALVRIPTFQDLTAFVLR
jgi:hypothetical protein